MSSIPSEFRCDDQIFHVVPDLDVNERHFAQIPDDHYLVRKATDSARLEKFKHTGNFSYILSN